MTAPPAISIILLCDGPDPKLAVTLASIREQRWLKPEVIVLDRSDGQLGATLADLDRAVVTRLLSVDDRSRSDALNKGVAAALGEWILFLTPGDRLVGDMVLSETHNWMKKTESGIVAGEVATDDGDIQRLHSQVNAVAGNFLPASATFYRSTLFAENGGFDPALETQAFYEFNVRLWKSHVRFKPLPLRITASPSGGKRPAPWRDLGEARAVRRRYFSFWRCLPWDVLAVVGGAWLRATCLFRR